MTRGSSTPRSDSASEDDRGGRQELVPIGVAARSAGISVFRARWYADQRLLGEVTRSQGKIRQLTSEQMRLLAEIADWRRRHLSIGEIRALLALRVGDYDLITDRLVDLARAIAAQAEAMCVLAEANAQVPTEPPRRPGDPRQRDTFGDEGHRNAIPAHLAKHSAASFRRSFRALLAPGPVDGERG